MIINKTWLMQIWGVCLLCRCEGISVYENESGAADDMDEQWGKIQIKFVHQNEYINAERTNRYIASGIKKKQTKAVVDALQKFKDLPSLDKKYFVKCLWIVPDARKDPDNLCFPIKFVLDGFQKAGVLKNDNMKHISGFEHRFEIDKEYKKTLIIEFVEVE